MLSASSSGGSLSSSSSSSSPTSALLPKSSPSHPSTSSKRGRSRSRRRRWPCLASVAGLALGALLLLALALGAAGPRSGSDASTSAATAALGGPLRFLAWLLAPDHDRTAQRLQGALGGENGEEEDGKVHADNHDHDHDLFELSKGGGMIYLIRHGEKSRASGNGLSATGIRRAQCLVDLFSLQRGAAHALDAPDADADAHADAPELHAARKSKARKGAGKKGKHHSKGGSHRLGTLPISALLAQDFNPATGKRSRPYATLVPLARALGIGVHHACAREDARCVRRAVDRLFERAAAEEQAAERAAQRVPSSKPKARPKPSVLIAWQHEALSDIAAAFGVRGVRYPKARSDIVFAIRYRHPGAEAGAAAGAEAGAEAGAQAGAQAGAGAGAEGAGTGKGEGQLVSITSQECWDLDERFFGWSRKNAHSLGAEDEDEGAAEDDADGE